MLFRINLLLMQIILFLLFQNKMLFASDMEKLNCKGVFWSHKEAQYAEWQVIKRVSTYKVYFKINDLKKTAKVSLGYLFLILNPPTTSISKITCFFNFQMRSISLFKVP